MKRSKMLRAGLILVASLITCCVVVSADGDWKPYSIDVHVKVFERVERGSERFDTTLRKAVDLKLYHFEDNGGTWKQYRANNGEVAPTPVVESWVRTGGRLAAIRQVKEYVKVKVVSVSGYESSEWRVVDVSKDRHGFDIVIKIYLDLPDKSGPGDDDSHCNECRPYHDEDCGEFQYCRCVNLSGQMCCTCKIKDEYKGRSHFSTDFSSGSAGLVTEWDVVPAGGELLLGSRPAGGGQIYVPGEYDNFIFDVDYRRIQEGNCFVCMTFFFRETWSIQPVGGYKLILTCYENNNCTWWLKVNDSNDSGKFNVLATEADVSSIPYSSHVQITVKDSHVVVEMAGREVLNLSGLQLDRSGQLGVYVNTDSTRCYVALDNLEVQQLR